MFTISSSAESTAECARRTHRRVSSAADFSPHSKESIKRRSDIISVINPSDNAVISSRVVIELVIS